jgi:hypothetical protein
MDSPMVENQHPDPRIVIWAYAYQMLLPQSQDRMGAIQTLLDDAHADAVAGARTWSGRFVREPPITHILVVSDSPEADEIINERLQTGLMNLGAAFSLTAPMIVANES